MKIQAKDPPVASFYILFVLETNGYDIADWLKRNYLKMIYRKR